MSRVTLLYIYFGFLWFKTVFEFKIVNDVLDRIAYSIIFNRPGVAGAVLQTPPSLIH